YNLLDNAVHHTTQGQIKIIAEVLDNHMVIHVMDTGSGIPPQEQDYIFHSFYRGSNKKKGLGLGLAIAKNMVEKLNGSIHVNSTIGVGSTFTFTMPLAKFLECTEASASS